MRKQFLLISLCALATGVVHAADKTGKISKSPWKTQAELGFIRTTGNTQTQTIAAKADVTYEVKKWRHHGHVEGYGTQSTDNTTGQSIVSAERYELSGSSNYKFSDRDYVLGLIDLQKDRFNGFDYERVLSAGYGHTAIKRTSMELELEIGPGIRFYKENDKSSASEPLLRLSGKYWWAINDHAKFTQVLRTDIGKVFTTTRSITGLQASISDELALKITYTIRSKSNVPPGILRTDTEFATTLVYSF